MVERIVKISVAAEVNSFLGGFDRIARKTREARTEAEALTAKLEAQKKAFETTGRSMLVFGGVAAAGLVLATKKAADFDQAMSNVAATGDDARGSISALREAALEAGADTVYSATESAGAIEELAKAGIAAKDILGGGLNGSLSLAAAGGIEVAEAAEIASDTLNQFKLSGQDATHVADVLAAGAGKASGGVGDLGAALKQTGQVANSVGLSVEETTAGLAAFASAGLKGSDAGTSFKTMLGALTPNSKAAAAEMERLGVNAFDAQGNFIGLDKFAGNLHTSLKGLTTQQRQASLEIMFGSDAVRAGIELYNQGERGIRKWIDAVNDQGYAARTAETRLDNLNGDLEKLSGAWDSALISIGTAGQGPLREVVQGLTELVDGFNDMPESGKVAVYWVGAIGSAAAVAGGLALIAVPKFAALKLSLIDLGVPTSRIDSAMGKLGTTMKALPYVAVGAGLVQVGNDLADTALKATGAKVSVDQLAESFEKIGAQKSIDDALGFGGDLALKNATSLGFLSDAGNTARAWIDQLNGFMPVAKLITESSPGMLSNLKSIDQQLASMVQSGDTTAAADAFEYLASKTDGSKESIAKLRSLLPEYGSAVKDAKDANTDAGAAAESAADKYAEQAEKVDGVRNALIDLVDQFNAQNSAQQAAYQANARWIEGLTSLAEAVKENGTSLDANTLSGSKNRDMLAALAGDAQAAAKAQFEVDQATMGAEEAVKRQADTLATQRRKFIDSAIAAGFNADEVKRLADKIFALPSKKDVAVAVATGQAQDNLNKFIRSNNGRVITLQTQIAGRRPSVGNDGGPGGFAEGGRIPGPPSSKDNMIAAVASGEFIVRASQVVPPENRRVLEYINAGGRMRGYSDGGFVQPRYASSSRWASGGPQGGQMVFPDRITLVDENGSILTQARVVADDSAAQALHNTFTLWKGKRR